MQSHSVRRVHPVEGPVPPCVQFGGHRVGDLGDRLALDLGAVDLADGQAHRRAIATYVLQMLLQAPCTCLSSVTCDTILKFWIATICSLCRFLNFVSMLNAAQGGLPWAAPWLTVTIEKDNFTHGHGPDGIVARLWQSN